MTTRSSTTLTSLPRGLVALCLLAGSLAAHEVPKELDGQRLGNIIAVFSSPFDEGLEWAVMADDGEKMLPYMAFIIANEKSKSRTVLIALIFARDYLTKYDCKSLVDPTVSRLMHENWEIKVYAMNLLSRIGDWNDTSPLVELMNDEKVAKSAAWCLEKLGHKRDLFALDHWLRVRASDAKGEKEEKETFDFIKKARDELRERLEKEAKANPVEPTEADKAVEKFADADAKVREAALETLRKVGSRADSTAVVALLHDPHAKVRAAAAEWLGAVGGKRELVALEIRLREPKATDDEAFNAVAKAKRAVAERVEADEKKLKAKSSDVKDGKK